MRKTLIALSIAGVAFATGARAEMAAPPAPAAGPPQYGTPGVNLELATKAVEAAAAEAKKNGWLLAIAVTTNGGHLVHFSRMDQAQIGSIQIAIQKAKAAAMFRRPTKVFQDGLAATPPNLALLTLEGVVASEGGIPLMRDGKVIGAIGCSGATGAQDGVACKAGADTIK